MDSIKIFRGSESIVRLIKRNNLILIEKFRMPRGYRIKEIDEPLRKKRTKQEVKLLKKARENDILVPEIYSQNKFTIEMEYISGIKKNKFSDREAEKLGIILANLHNLDIIHGDFTLSNFIFSDPKDSKSMDSSGVYKIYIIDFGLGFFSRSIEDKAIDIFTTIRSINDNSTLIIFLKSYLKNVDNKKQIMKRILKIRERFRYGARFKKIDDALNFVTTGN